MALKMLSLFDGSGGFPLAGTMCGIVPVYASEVEPYPIAVTRSRFPDMIHLGDVSKVSGAAIEPVDLITFGSPCQDLSVAGRRAGLKHEANGDEETTRSGLFMEAVRIIKEMRKATNGRYPTFALWENVPGAFSSNKGEDFRIVLDELIKIAEPEAPALPTPDKNGWAYADCIVGDGWSVAYRIFDAQYWGVPQRRRRILLVADFRGERAGKILFEREGLSGHSAEGFRSWQRTAGSFTPCPGATGYDGYNGSLTEEASSTLGVNCGVSTSRNGIVLNGQTLFEPCGWDGGQISPTLTKQNAGGNQRMPDKDNFTCVLQPFGICSKDFNSMKSDNPHSGIYKAETARTLDGNGGNPSCNQGGIAVVESYAIQGSMIGREDKNGPQGDGINEDVSFTLNTVDRHAVCYGIGRDAFNQGQNAKFAPTFEKEIQPALVAKGPGAIQSRYTVRRLTPTECARLQGFPDEWGHPDNKENFTDEEYKFWLDVRNTHAAINGKTVKEYTKRQMLTWYNKLHTDSAEYKMWGNGIALPTALYVMQGIADALHGGNQV